MDQVMFPLNTVMMRRIFDNVVVFDLETTYSHPQEVIQIASVRVTRGRILPKRFHSYVRPKRKIDPMTTSYTGITNQHLKTAPKIMEVLENFSRFCGDSLLIAHNGRQFDFRLLQEACASVRCPTRSVRFVDSMHLSWAMWGRKDVPHGLDHVAARLRVRNGGLRRHDARYDAKLLAECFLKLGRRFRRSHGAYTPNVYPGVLPAAIDKDF